MSKTMSTTRVRIFSAKKKSRKRLKKLFSRPLGFGGGQEIRSVCGSRISRRKPLFARLLRPMHLVVVCWTRSAYPVGTSVLVSQLLLSPKSRLFGDPIFCRSIVRRTRSVKTLTPRNAPLDAQIYHTHCTRKRYHADAWYLFLAEDKRFELSRRVSDLLP